MSQSQAASALERLYGDTSVRDELVDSDATILLTWAEAQINRLAAKAIDDGLFEAAYYKLTRLVGRINRFVGKRRYADDVEKQKMLAKMTELALEAGYTIVEPQMSEFAALSDADAIRLIIRLLDATQSPPPALPAPPSTSTERYYFPPEGESGFYDEA